MRPSRFGALALAAGLAGWKAAVARIAARWQSPVRAGLAAALVALTGAPLGLRPPALWSGLRWGLAAAAAAAAGVALSTGLRPVHAQLAAHDLPAPAVAWLTLRIPLGTVWSEEAAYRAALGTVAAGAFGRSGGRLLQAAAFGLSHVYDARVTRQPVVTTVLATGAAGWLFAWLAERSGSLAAPILTHLAVNEGGAVAVLAVQRR